MSKPWWRSKTIWVNAIALVALIAQAQWGFVIDAQEQGALIVLVNLVLRIVTRAPLALRSPSSTPDPPGGTMIPKRSTWSLLLAFVCLLAVVVAWAPASSAGITKTYTNRSVVDTYLQEFNAGAWDVPEQRAALIEKEAMVDELVKLPANRASGMAGVQWGYDGRDFLDPSVIRTMKLQPERFPVIALAEDFLKDRPKLAVYLFRNPTVNAAIARAAQSRTLQAAFANVPTDWTEDPAKYDSLLRSALGIGPEPPPTCLNGGVGFFCTRPRK